MREQLSQQASAVRGILAQRRCHLTADEIIGMLPDASTATVYRCLDQLAARGMVRKLSLSSRSAVYELVREPHTHFVCRICGKILDIPLDLSGLVSEAAHFTGNQVEWSETTAYGVCSACSSKQDNNNEEEKQNG